jgi:hypothetical protein
MDGLRFQVKEPKVIEKPKPKSKPPMKKSSDMSPFLSILLPIAGGVFFIIFLLGIISALRREKLTK